MKFSFKNMSQYVRNVVEPILRASHTVSQTKIEDVNTRLSKKLDEELTKFQERLDTTLTEYKTFMENKLEVQQQTIEAFPVIRVGTIVIWPLAANPSDMAYYLECNGQAINRDVYPELYALIGTNVPNLNDRVLQGRGGQAVGAYLAAGLPNITGSFAGSATYRGTLQAGAFRTAGDYQRVMATDHRNEEDTRYNFDASWSNAIYGRSTTVQPNAFVVRYLMRAKP